MTTDAPPATHAHHSVQDLAAESLRAWNAHDVDAILAVYADDAVYDQHDGSLPTTGRGAIRQRYESLFETVPDLRFQPISTHFGDAHWAACFVARTGVAGNDIEFEIVDVITVRDGLIVRKDSYLGAPGSSLAGAAAFLDRFREVFRAPTAETVTALYTEDATLAHPELDTVLAGRAAIRGYWRGVFTALPDLRIEVRDHAVRDRTVFIKIEVSATLGDRPLRWDGVDVFELDGERAVAGAGFFDPEVLTGGAHSR